ncbi:ABC transporter substrate-binding protein [Pseudomonas paraeruginosa]|uniref:ABC transporter substrate-binding protein n=1 Tax=Pseudomonas aeruginosa group TaxID=136841 RepID=UPI00053D530F|nr:MULTISPECIES: ABC transporter substrate-binding protein [Pseudomonas aeruginosa group]
MRRLRHPRRLLSILLVLLLCAFTHASEAAQLILVSASQGAALGAFRDALAQRRPQDRVELRTPAALPDGSTFASDTRLLLLGPEALAWRLRQRQAPPTLALLLSRVDGQRLLPAANDRRGHSVEGLCVLWSDPPAARQLRLARLILPGIQRIGVLYGKDSEFLLEELRREARSQGLQLFVANSSGNDDPRPLQFLLGNSDLLLGIDDKQLYNSQSIKSLLLGSYAKNRALLGPTAAFVKAGSLASSYSDQEDWLDTLDELLGQPPRRWPPSLYPGHFKVLGNRQVARSLGIDLASDAELGRRLAEGEEP